jgi:alkylhydroperoxidase family enzyme
VPENVARHARGRPTGGGLIMARIQFVDGHDANTAALVNRIKQQRRGTVLKLYQVLLNSPALAESWFEHLNAVRWKTELTGRLRELVIIRIAFIHTVQYVIKQHIPNLAQADGVTLEECDALRLGINASSFSEAELAALVYAEAMTRTVDVPDDVFANLVPHFNEKQIVEITVLIATYNMHLRVIKALQIEPEDP